MKDTISFKFQLTFLLEFLQLDENKIDIKSGHFSVKILPFNNYNSLVCKYLIFCSKSIK